MRKTGRSANIELLRIVAMLMIIMYHIICHCVNVQLTDGASIARWGNGLFNHPLFYKRLWLLAAIMPFGLIGNALFILISGYFMVQKGKSIDLVRISRKLLMQLGFAAVGLLFATSLVYQLSVSNEKGYVSLIDANYFNNAAWLAGYYFTVVVIGKLLLNNILLQFTKSQYKEFLIVLFTLTQFIWPGGLMDGLAGGLRTSIFGMFLYALGGYIKLYDPFVRVRSVSLLLGLLVIELIEYISYYNITSQNIENYYKNGMQGDFIQSIPTFDNFHVLIVLAGVIAFEIFKRCPVPSCETVNSIGSATCMVYLIHDNEFFYSVWDKQDWISLLNKSVLEFSGKLIGYTVATFFIGCIAYIAYLMLLKLMKMCKNIFIKCEDV